MRSVAAGAAFRVFGSADVHVKGKRLTRDARDLRASPYGAYGAGCPLFVSPFWPFRIFACERSPMALTTTPSLLPSPSVSPRFSTRPRVRRVFRTVTCTHAFVSWGGPRPPDHSLLVMLLVLLVDVVAMRCTAAVRQCRTRPTCRKHIKSARRMHLHVPSCSRKSEDFGVVNTCILLKW